MTRLAIVVEGKTEKEFIGRVLSRHLKGKGIKPTPILPGRGRGARGGNISVDSIAQEMARLYWHFDMVTSLVDYYGFRDKGTRTVEELEEYLKEKTRHRIPRRWDSRKIFPYVQQHEFEGLLFSDVSAFSTLPDAPTDLQASLHEIRSQFPTPEDINDHQNTAPSRRILRLMPRYRKVANGSVVAEKMGLDVIRAECPRFNIWVKKLESLRTAGC